MQDLTQSTGPNQSNTPQQSKPPIKGEEYKKNSLNPEDLDERWLRWKCLKCGFMYEGQKPVNVCPKCGNNDPDLFDDAY